MVATRRSQGGLQNSLSSANKKSGKRSSEPGSSPTAKRGKTKSSSMTMEETMEEVIRKAKEDVRAALNTELGIEKVGEKSVAVEDKWRTGEHETGQVEKYDEVIKEEHSDCEMRAGDKHILSTKDNSVAELNATAVRNDFRGSFSSNEDSDHTAHVKKIGQEAAEKLADCLDDLENKAKEYHAKRRMAPVCGEYHTMSLPSTILERGIIYFFLSTSVDGDNKDVQHSYIVLRPLPLGLPLGSTVREGLTAFARNARILTLSKKLLPRSYQDRFFVLVEKAHEPTDKVKSIITTNHSSARTPVAEGIYAISHNTAEAHLSYHIKYPEIGKIHDDVGIKQKGCFAVLAQNPENPSSRTTFPDKLAIYPPTLLRHFSQLRWMPLIPELLGFDNTQLLIVGEDEAKVKENGTADRSEGKRFNPLEEDREFEHEHCMVVAHLRHDDAVFDELAKGCEEYPEQTTCCLSRELGKNAIAGRNRNYHVQADMSLWTEYIEWRPAEEVACNGYYCQDSKKTNGKAKCAFKIMVPLT